MGDSYREVKTRRHKKSGFGPVQEGAENGVQGSLLARRRALRADYFKEARHGHKAAAPERRLF